TAQVPTYSISASHRTGMRVVDAGQDPLIVAEGLFASELIAPLAAAGLLADAMVLRRPVPIVFALRLIRDLRESRKPPLTRLRRGAGLARDQREAITRWRNAGMRPTGMRSGVRSLRRDTALAHAEARIRARGHRPDVLAITAVSFLREGPLGTEVLAVRKRGTGSYMQVGGKLEPGEAALQAAIREVEEELGVRLAPEDLELLGEFEAAARAACRPGPGGPAGTPRAAPGQGPARDEVVRRCGPARSGARAPRCPQRRDPRPRRSPGPRGRCAPGCRCAAVPGRPRRGPA